MTTEELLARRWAAHRLGLGRSPTAVDAVAWAGALQAQDEAMAHLAVALRTKDGGRTGAETALAAGGLVRSHVLRPTWHLTTAEDLGWLQALTGPSVRRALGSSFRREGVGPEVVDRAVRIVAEVLAPGPADRQVIRDSWARAGLPLQSPLPAHYLIEAEARGLVCQAGLGGPDVRYTLTAERLPTRAPVTGDEALARLAQTYLRSHGPATDRDAAWWTGLSLGAVRRGLGAAGAQRRSGPEGQDYWVLPSSDEEPPPRWAFLGGFDEYVLGYADRSAVVPADSASEIIAVNGVFRPVVLLHGRVVGTWAPTGSESPPRVRWLGGLDPGTDEAFREAADRLAAVSRRN